MIEVYTLGLLVAYVKLTDLATIQIGPAAIAVVGLMLVTIATDALLDQETIWRRLYESLSERVLTETQTKTQAIMCETCGFVSPTSNGNQRCPRCTAKLHYRKLQSLARTWALVLAAAILYIPANLYPVMIIISRGYSEHDTILSGVIRLADEGMWPLAVLVFFASILVPLLKMLGLGLLLVTTQLGLITHLIARTRLYRMIDFVGRWSMIDIFMLSILVALVQLGEIATIEPGIGAIAFAGVVVLTILATESFDPRLMWDAKNSKIRKKLSDTD